MDKIMIKEDDDTIRQELSILLVTNGYEVVYNPPCDLALLDINLPNESGFDICRKLRQESSVPIIFLTARNSYEDEIVGFGVGGDDFIRKPYNSAVLLARIARLLKHKPMQQLSFKGLTLNLSDMTVRFEDNAVELTKNETRILAFLMSKEICTRQELIEELWNNSIYIDENTLYVNINRLRERLKDLGADGFIRTIRGVGYRL